MTTGSAWRMTEGDQEEDKIVSIISVRVTNEQRNLFERKATAAGMKLSEWLRGLAEQACANPLDVAPASSPSKARNSPIIKTAEEARSAVVQSDKEPEDLPRGGLYAQVMRAKKAGEV